MDELIVVGLLISLMVLVGALFWRYPAQQWVEQRIPFLFSSGMSRSLESIALSRPINHFAINALLLLGVFTLIRDITGTELSTFLRYTVALLVAAFALTMARHSASQRADLHTT